MAKVVPVRRPAAPQADWRLPKALERRPEARLSCEEEVARAFASATAEVGGSVLF